MVPPLLAMSLLTTACSSAGAPSAKASAAPDRSCSVSTLQLGPQGFAPYGLARAGPPWFSAFGRVEPGGPATLASGGGPNDGWKVVIHPDPKSTGTVNLSGAQCSSGMAVRFCYSTKSCDWAARLQSSVAILPVDVAGHRDYAGYMVFPGQGLMRLSVSDSHGVVGKAVIEVPQVSI